MAAEVPVSFTQEDLAGGKDGENGEVRAARKRGPRGGGCCVDIKFSFLSARLR